MFLWPQEAANLTHAHAQVVFENLLVETIWPWHRNFNYCLFAAQVPKVFLRLRAIPGDEAPGEAGIGTSKPCFLAAYHGSFSAAEGLVDIYAANLVRPQASQLVMFTCLCKCL